MDELLQKIASQDAKLDQIYSTVRKIKLYFMIMLILSLVTFVIPLISLIFVIPWFIRTIGSTYQGLL